MTAIKQRVFRGGFQRSEPSLLLPEQATVARDCLLDTGSLRPLKDTLEIFTLPSSGRKSIYLYDWTGAPADNWLSWTDRVKVSKGPIALDAFFRLYWTGEGAPKMKYVLSGAEQSAVTLGVPQSASTITTVAQDKSVTTWTRRWGWWYEDSSGVRYDVNRVSLRWLAAQWTVDTGAEYYFYQFPSRKPIAVYEDGVAMDEGQVGSLAASQWGWVAATGRIYVRITPVAGAGDPDDEAVDFITAEHDYMPEASVAAYLTMTEATPGQEYSISALNAGRRAEATNAAKFVLWFQAYSNTGYTLGRVYSTSSTWAGDSDLRINGAKVTLDLVDNTILAGLGGTYNVRIDYDTSDASDYKADRNYFFTLVDELGQEGPPTALTNAVGVMPNQDVLVTGLPTTSPAGYAPTVYKRLYRAVTSDAGTAMQLVTTLYDPASPAVALTTNGDILLATASVLDSIADVELGEVCITGSPFVANSNWLPPPTDMEGLTACPGGFFAGYSGKTVYFSEPNYPYAWPRRYAVNVTIDIKDLGVTGNTVTVLGEGNPKLITVPTPGVVTVTDVPNNQAMLNEHTISDGGGVWFASQDGLCVISGLVVTVASEPYMLKTQWEARLPATAILALYDRWLMCFCDGGSFMLRVGDAVTGLVELSDTPTGAYFRPENDALYLIVGDKIMQWQAGTATRTYTWTSKEYLFSKPIEFRAAKASAEAYGVSLNLTADGAAQGAVTISADRARLIPKMRRAKRWVYSLSGTGAVDEFVLTQSMGDL